LTACAIPSKKSGMTSASNDSWECLNLQEELTSCGSCNNNVRLFFSFLLPFFSCKDVQLTLIYFCVRFLNLVYGYSQCRQCRLSNRIVQDL
jgi:hypothetical protein